MDFLMVGNSLRSDILPVLALGAEAVHIPYAIIWAHESTSKPIAQPGFHQLETIDQLPDLVGELAASTAP